MPSSSENIVEGEERGGRVEGRREGREERTEGRREEKLNIHTHQLMANKMEHILFTDYCSGIIKTAEVNNKSLRCGNMREP